MPSFFTFLTFLNDNRLPNSSLALFYLKRRIYSFGLNRSIIVIKCVCTNISLFPTVCILDVFIWNNPISVCLPKNPITCVIMSLHCAFINKRNFKNSLPNSLLWIVNGEHFKSVTISKGRLHDKRNSNLILVFRLYIYIYRERGKERGIESYLFVNICRYPRRSLH